MKITRIQISNFLGARAVDLDLKKPVALIAGKNGAGKSSIRDAIALAFTADLCRVHLKKEAATLISEGGESCFVEITTDADTYGVAITAAGKISDTMVGKETPAALPYVLDAQRFARMTDSDRRTFLFGLMGIKLDGATVKDRLTVRGCNSAKAEQIMPILRTGFEAASKEAASRARDAKAGWRTATGGEAWGKDKSAKWQPEPLPADAENAGARYENAVVKRKEVDSELSKAQQDLGAAKAERRRQHEAEEKRMELHERAGKIERIKTKLNIDSAELAEWEQRIAVLCAALKSQDAVACPECGVMLVMDGGSLVHAAPMAKGTEDDLAKLPGYENSLALMRRSVANDKRDLEAAQRAAEQLKELDGLKANADVGAAEAKVAELTAKRAGWQADADKYRDTADKYSRRQALIEQAANLHQDVLDWTHIADALAPDGIPAELLAEALDPINEHLRLSAADAEWEPAQIDSDMRITYGLRDYALISESEKWRADAMITEAVSRLAGVKLLVLDRFDVLDAKGREDLLYWLDGMAQDGEIDTALIFGTLKSLPAQVLPSIDGFWIDSGVTGQMKEAA